MNKTTSLFQTKKTTITAQAAGSSLLIRFAGVLDESVDLDPLTRNLEPLLKGLEAVSIDVSGVERLNSVGIRQWVVFLRKIKALRPIAFAKVGEVIIENFAIEQNILLAPGTPIGSFDVPFVCPNCLTREIHSLSTAKLPSSLTTFRVLQVKCTACGALMKTDTVEEDYISALRFSRGEGN